MKFAAAKLAPKFLTVLGGVLTSTVVMAGEGMLGTKDSSAQAYSPSNSGGGFLQMIFAVIIVFALMKWLLPKMMSKFGGKLSTGLNSSIKVEESATFPGGTLQVVTVRDRVLLLGVTSNSISTLADLGVHKKADPGPTFMEYLDAAPGDAKTAVVEVLPDDSEASAALQRLQQLMR